MSHTLEMLSNEVDKQQRKIIDLENKLQQAYNLRDKQLNLTISLEQTIDSEISKVCLAVVQENVTIEDVKNLESIVIKCLLSKFNIILKV